jgi:NAD-dependent SIR2 family protein deacetylase
VKTVVFTGAGAAKADGLPLQTEVFAEFFSRAAKPPSRGRLANDVGHFFEVVFGFDPRQHPSRLLPTFEEALGVLELATSREEAIVGLGGDRTNQGVQHFRRQLILALAATVARDSTSPASFHSKLVAHLRAGSLLEDITFITTNYDTLLDDAIEMEALTASRGTGSLVDYGLDGVVQPDASRYAEERTFPCYKIHGSLNWLYCSACDILDITYASDGVLRLVDEPNAARCPSCETLRTPVIVPPSYYKTMSSVHLAVVWGKGFRAMREAEQVVFCGYSFPDADMHVKYLVKRAQLNRDPAGQPLRATLVNHHPGKLSDITLAEQRRFRRFMGEADVTDSGLSFEEFASDPLRLLTQQP